MKYTLMHWYLLYKWHTQRAAIAAATAAADRALFGDMPRWPKLDDDDASGWLVRSITNNIL